MCHALAEKLWNQWTKLCVTLPENQKRPENVMKWLAKLIGYRILGENAQFHADKKVKTHNFKCLINCLSLSLGGVQTREISCQRIIANGYPGIVDESECEGPKPPQEQICNKGVTCAQWHTDPWKPV